MAKQYLDKTGLDEVINQTKRYVDNQATDAAETMGQTILETFASTADVGIVSTTTQSFGGEKTFADGIKVGNAKLAYSTSGSDKILTVSFV